MFLFVASQGSRLETINNISYLLERRLCHNQVSWKVMVVLFGFVHAELFKYIDTLGASQKANVGS